MSPEVIDSQAVLQALQARWGANVIRRGGELALPARLPSGFAALDSLLSGGIPVGRISEFIGRPTSGKTTVALSLLVSAQRGGALAVLIDPACQADPDYLARLGVSLADLLLVRGGVEEALALLRDIIASRIPCAILLHLPNRLGYRDSSAVTQELRRALPLLAHTQTLVVVLTPYPITLVPKLAAQLVFSNEGWLTEEGDVTGCRVSVLVKREIGGGVERRATLELAFPDSFAGASS
jgi:hypothetical protein